MNLWGCVKTKILQNFSFYFNIYSALKKDKIYFFKVNFWKKLTFYTTPNAMFAFQANELSLGYSNLARDSHMSCLIFKDITC